MKSERISPFWVNGYQPFSACSGEDIEEVRRKPISNRETIKQQTLPSTLYLLIRRVCHTFVGNDQRLDGSRVTIGLGIFHYELFGPCVYRLPSLHRAARFVQQADCYHLALDGVQFHLINPVPQGLVILEDPLL